MSALKTLHFVAAPKQGFNPLLHKRNKLVSRLEEQKALVANPLHFAIEHRWTTQADGCRELVERKRKIRPWWRPDMSGKILFTVRYGQKPIEFEKGKAAIEVASKEELPHVIDLLIAAIHSGELDDAIAALGRARIPTKKAQSVVAAA